MRHSRTILCVIAVAAFFSPTGGMARAMTLDEAFKKLDTHKFGRNHQVLDFLRDVSVTSHSDPALRKKLNVGLVRILDSNAAYDAKQFACRQLALTAAEEHIGVLARQLGDEKMTHMALYVLTHIDSPQVDKALLSALGATTGNTRLGIINMLGNRRCADAVKPLGRLMVSGDEVTSIAAIRALGHIGTESAHSQFLLYDVADDPPRKHSEAKMMAFVQANLDFGDRFLAKGNKTQARRRYLLAFDKDNPGYIRAVGLKGLVATMGEQAGPFVAQALRSDDRELYGMAASTVETVPERKTAEAIAGELAELQPSAQCLLINALGARHDGAGVEIVKNACKSHNVPVKHAALSALGRIGDESCVALLIEHAAIESLTNLAGENINATLVDRLRDGTSAEKVTICRALLARNAAEAAPALVDVAKTGNSSARAEALKALHSLASRQEVPALVDLIFTVEPTQADQVGKAIATVGRHNFLQQECTLDILSRYDQAANADQQVALLLALGALGHEQALPTLREALRSNSTRISYAAIKALSVWPVVSPAGDLLDAAKSASSQSHRVLALRGFIDLIDARMLPADRKLANLRQAMEVAGQDAEKKKALSVLSSLDTLEAFQMAMSHLDNPSIKNEAALAACQIAGHIYATQGRLIKNDLERIVRADVVEATKQQARQILGNINKVDFYVTDWEVSGPYFQKGKNYAALFDVAFAPEIDGGKDAKWRRMPAGKDPAQPWFLDLLKALDGGEQRVAYLRTRLEWPAEQRVTLRIGSDDGVKLWINGRLVHANNVARGFAPDQDSAGATLKKGQNIILMKITQNSMPWGASLRIEHQNR